MYSTSPPAATPLFFTASNSCHTVSKPEPPRSRASLPRNPAYGFHRACRNCARGDPASNSYHTVSNSPSASSTVDG